MTNKIKIVFIGATSMSFGMNTLRDLFSSKEFCNTIANTGLMAFTCDLGRYHHQ